MKIVLAIQLFLKQFFQSVETIARLVFLTRYPRLPVSRVNDSMVVLGNGPSLKGDLSGSPDFLKGKDLICVNYFPITEFFDDLKPGYFITTAPELWLEDVEPRYLELSNKIFENLAQKTHWPLILFIPFEARKYDKWKQNLKGNTHIKIIYFNNTPVEGWDWFSYFLFDKKLGMPRPHNVMIPALMLSIWCGYKKIYLLGADHSWLSDIAVSDQNDVLINQKHFYDENKSKHRTMKKVGKGKRNLAEVLHKFMNTFFSYYHISAYAGKKGVEIINATKGSFIDAFPRKYPDEISH